MFEAEKIDIEVKAATVDGTRRINLLSLHKQQEALASTHADNKGWSCHRVSATFTIVWKAIKKDEKHTSSLLKHSAYQTWANVEEILRQLNHDNKRGLSVECSYYFARRSYGIVPLTINSAVDDALVNNSRHESAAALIVADAVAGGKGRSKKRTTKTDKLLAQREERAILRDDLDKRLEALQSMWLCTSSRCKFKGKYC